MAVSKSPYSDLPVGLQRLYREILEDDIQATGQVPESSAARTLRLSRLVAEYREREQESLALYEPMDHIEPFHACEAPERVLRGSNRSGKTLGAAVEFARAVTAHDPYSKYPSQDGRAFVVGKDENHNSEVLYRKLFRPGAFYTIEDQTTGRMRAYRPWDPDDMARKAEARRAPPLIPPRMVKDISWTNKKESCPSLVTLVNGWEIRFFSSKGSPPQGSDIDLAWFDEEIVNCLAGWSCVYDPVLGGFRRIDQIDSEWHVRSFNQLTGAVETKKALKPFIKGHGEIVRVSLSNGEQIYATRQHKILSACSRWLSVQDAFSLGVAVQGFDGPSVPGEPSTWQSRRFEQAQGPCGFDRGSPASSSTDCGKGPSCGVCFAPLGFSTGCHERLGICELLRTRPRISLQSSSFHDFHRATEGLFWEGFGIVRQPVFSKEESRALATLARSSSPAWGSDTSLQSSSLHFSHTCSANHPAEVSTVSPAETRRVCVTQHVDSGSLVQDFQSHCFGDPRLDDGRAHCDEGDGQDVFPLSVDAQGFDRLSMRQGDWVARSPHSRMELLCDRQALVLDEPSDSPVYIESIESVGRFPIWDFTVPGTWNYINGKICNHNSEWYNEIAARLIDREGKFFWSATAQLGGAQLFDLCEEADRERTKPEPRVVEFFAHIKDNPHFTDDQRELFFSKMTDEQMRIRVEGEFAFTSYRVYPEFDEQTQGCEFFQIPPTWTRYAVIDPGRQVCAVIFAAVPPPSDPRHDHCYLYDELYLSNCTAEKFGQAMRTKTQGQCFQAFIIDHQGGRLTDIGGGLNVEAQYSEALKKYGVRSVATGHSFVWGASDVDGGIEKTRSWLNIRDNSDTYLQFFPDKMPNFSWEMKRYHYKRVAGRITEKPDKRNDHMPDNLRYLAMYDPKWVRPRVRSDRGHGVLNRVREKMKKKQKAGGVTLGPSSYKQGAGA